MITAIEFVPYDGAVLTLRADKNMREKNAWHLASVKGNALPPVSTVGESSFKLPGTSYDGITIDSREIELELYADAYSPTSLQTMLADVSRILSVGHDAIGYLRLVNGNGAAYRIMCRPTDFDVDDSKRRSVKFTAALECPYVFFEDDAATVLPVFAVTGGKEYPQDSGLERPYTFGNIVAGSGTQTINAYNAGDVAAPCTLRLFGAGLSKVVATNTTTGASITVEGMGVGGIEICTDPNGLYARFADGSDASRYVSLFSDVSAFEIVPGANAITIAATATSLTAAGTELSFRGRYTTCL